MTPDILSLPRSHLSREPDVGDTYVGEQFILNLGVLAHLASCIYTFLLTLRLVEMALVGNLHGDDVSVGSLVPFYIQFFR